MVAALNLHPVLAGEEPVPVVACCRHSAASLAGVSAAEDDLARSVVIMRECSAAAWLSRTHWYFLGPEVVQSAQMLASWEAADRLAQAVRRNNAA